MSGLSTPNLTATVVADSILVNRSGSTKVQSFPDLAAQILGVGAVSDTIYALMVALGATVAKASLSQLNSVVGSFADGDVGLVVLDDTVAYRGMYARTAGVWVKKSDLPSVISQAIVDQANLAVANALAAAADSNAAKATALTYVQQARDARDVAAGYVSSIVSQSVVPVFATHAGFSALPIPVGMLTVFLTGYYAAGDGAGKTIKRVSSQPTTGSGVRSADRFLPSGATDATNGGWWDIAERIIDASQLGARPANADNRALIQAALDSSLNVTIMVPGIYLVAGCLNMRSRQKLTLGPGVTLQQANGTNDNVIRNALWNAVPVAVTGTVTYSYTVTTENIEFYATIPLTAHGKVAGGYVSLQGATNFGWNGVYRVRSVIDANTFTVWLYTKPTDASPAGTLTVSDADAFITVEGGEIDYNNENNNTAGTYKRHVVFFENVFRPTIRNVLLSRGFKYGILLANVAHATVHDIELYTYSDGIHFQGSVWGANVRNISGRAGDDLVAFTGGDFAAYTQGIGDFDGIVVDGLYPSNCIYAFKMTGNDNHWYRSVSVKNIAGICRHGAVYAQNDTDTDKCRIESLLVENVSITSLNPTSYPVLFARAVEIKSFIARNVTMNNADQVAVSIDNATAVGRMVIENLIELSPHLTMLVQVVATATVGELYIDGKAALSSTGFLAYVAATAVVNELTFGDGVFGGDPAARILQVSGTGVVKSVLYKKGFHATTVHSVYDEANSGVNQGVVPLITFCGRWDSAVSWINLRAAAVVHRIILDAVMMGVRTTHHIVFNSTATGGGVVEGSAHNQEAFRLISKIAGAGAIYVNGVSLKNDIANHQDRRDGDVVNNVNSTANNGTDGNAGTGLFACMGVASGSWKKFGTVGGAGNQY